MIELLIGIGSGVALLVIFWALWFFISGLLWRRREHRRHQAWVKSFTQWMDDLENAKNWEQRRSILGMPPSSRMEDW